MKNFKYVIIILFASSLIITSCSKVDEMEDNQEMTSTRSNEVINLDHPISNNDVYMFRDKNHFLTYFKEMQNLYDIDYEQFRFESSQNLDNLNSRESNIVTVYQRMSNDKFENPKDRYVSDISDPIIQSIANLDYEIQVGEALLSITYLYE